jgi:hypothetical protein
MWRTAAVALAAGAAAAFGAFGDVISSFAAPGSNCTGLAYDGTYIYSLYEDQSYPGGGWVYKINPGTGSVIMSFGVANVPPMLPSWDGLAYHNDTIYEGRCMIDWIFEWTTGGSLISSWGCGWYHTGLTYWEGVGLLGGDHEQQPQHLVTLPPGEPYITLVAPANEFGNDGVYLYASGSSVVRKYTTAGSVADSAALPVSGTGCDYGGGYLWVGGGSPPYIYKLNPVSVYEGLAPASWGRIKATFR